MISPKCVRPYDKYVYEGSYPKGMMEALAFMPGINLPGWMGKPKYIERDLVQTGSRDYFVVITTWRPPGD